MKKYCVILLILIGLSSLYSEVFVMENGDVIEGNIVKSDENTVTVSNDGVVSVLSKNKIAKIYKNRDQYKKDTEKELEEVVDEAHDAVTSLNDTNSTTDTTTTNNNNNNTNQSRVKKPGGGLKAAGFTLFFTGIGAQLFHMTSIMAMSSVIGNFPGVSIGFALSTQLPLIGPFISMISGTFLFIVNPPIASSYNTFDVPIIALFYTLNVVTALFQLSGFIMMIAGSAMNAKAKRAVSRVTPELSPVIMNDNPGVHLGMKIRI